MASEQAERYARQLAELIRIPTVDGQELAQFAQLRARLRALFPHIFSAAEYEEFRNGFLLRWKGRDPAKRPWLLMNHHDVVEAPEAGWTHPPFAGEIADGKLWGRGTLDDKGPLWAMLCAADELAAQGFVPARDIYFESSCTEETDGAGARHIVSVLQARGVRFEMILDEGGMILHDPLGIGGGQCAMAAVGEKSCADLRFTVRGSGGHASTPGKDNALVRLSRFINAAEKAVPSLFPARITPAVEEMLRRMSEDMTGVLRLVCRHPRLFRPVLRAVLARLSPTTNAMVRTTCAFTMCGGAAATNVLPHKAWCVGNMRFAHHQGSEAGIAAITRLAEKHGVEVKILDPPVDSSLTSCDSTAFRVVERAVDAAFPGVRTIPYVATGASDSRFFDGLADGCVRLAPFCIDDQQLESIHGIDENVDVAALPPAVAFFQHIMAEEE